LRFKLYATVGACLAAAAFTLPGLASASSAGAATSPSAAIITPLTAKPATPTLNVPPQPSGTKDCAAPTSPLVMQCQSLVATSAKAKAAARAAAQAAVSAKAKGESPAVSSNGPLTPTDLQAAYGLASDSSSAGTGETVAIVDAFYDPNVQSDLAAYRLNFNLPACDTSTGAGCLNVFNQSGGNLADGATPPQQSPSDDSWVSETSLDVQMVSAICPNCTIDLVEANSDELADLTKSVDTAVSLGAKFVSNSWSGADYPGESAYDSYFNHPGVAITAASGDYGYAAGYPASSQFVTSVGGTYLNEDTSDDDWTSTVWNDNGSQNTDDIAGATASGCSAGEPQPSWGIDATDSTASIQCANRTENDVSAVADAPSGVDIYDSVDCGGFCDAYGTSVATPIIASIYALAGTPKPNTYPASYIHQSAADLTKVTSGSDGTCESGRAYLCNASKSLGSGYNGPAGFGTPNQDGNLTPFTETATGDIISVADPGTYDVQQGVSVTLPAIKAIDNTSGHTLKYTASGLPAGLSINTATGVISGKVSFVENDTVHVAVTDGTGASTTVYFRIEASGSLTADYHAGTGLVGSYWDDKCLDDTGNSSNNGTKIQIWQCTSGDASQVWSFKPTTTAGEVGNAGTSQLGTIDIHGKCLNIVNNGTANGAKIQLYTCNGGANELWEIAGGYAELYNPASGKCLEDPSNSTKNGTQLDIWSCNDQPWQGWVLPGSPFESAVAGKCINDSGNSSSNGAAIVSYTCNGAGNEKLQVQTAGPYALLLINGKCLNATGNGTVDGTTIQLYTCANSSDDVYSANLWYLTAYGQLENAQAEKCLAIPNNSTTNSTRLELEDCYGEPGEVWSAS
jgi:hypothetical protein